MSASTGIYLIVDFDWSQPFDPEQGKKARKLHDVVQGKTWIKEVVAGSGGLGAGHSSIWIFWLPDYAALNTLLRDHENEVCQAYTAFFSELPAVVEKIREEVLFV